MKKGVSISTFKSPFAPITFITENISDFSKECSKAKEYGYDGVDLFLDKKTPQEMKEIKSVLDDCGLQISMIIFRYLAEMGVNFTIKDDEKRDEALKLYCEHIALADSIGGRSMPIGVLRGNINPSESLLSYYDKLAKSCEVISNFSKNTSITLCLEPINRYEVNTLNSVQETVSFLDSYKLSDIKILADLFHMTIEDVDICAQLRNAGAKIFHMHVSDSNRRAPSMGNIDYHAVISTLKEIGYDGYLSLETLSFGEADKTAKVGCEYLRSVLTDVGV